MNTTANRQGETGGNGRGPQPTRWLARISLALIASAGVGALVGSASASTATKPPAAVVPGNAGSGTRLSAPDSNCTLTQPGTRVVLLAYQVSSADCSKPPMLVAAR